MPNAGEEKFLLHLLLQSEQGKMAGNGAGQQKKQQIFFRLTAFAGRRWRLVFSFESLGLAGMTITRLANKNFSSQIKKNMISAY